jgi:inosine-uridine nucleoside N-ribohydrolase
VADALDGLHQIEQLVIMGGDFGSATPEHNLVCDTTAAQVVFGAGAPALIVGIDQTERVVLDSDQVAAIGGGGALGAHLAAEITQFRKWLGRPDSPHDAVALLALVRPDLFAFAAGEVTVDDFGNAGEVTVDDFGNTTLRRHADGPHRVVTDLDAETLGRDLVSRIKQAQW